MNPAIPQLRRSHDRADRNPALKAGTVFALAWFVPMGLLDMAEGRAVIVVLCLGVACVIATVHAFVQRQWPFQPKSSPTAPPLPSMPRPISSPPVDASRSSNGSTSSPDRLRAVAELDSSRHPRRARRRTASS